MGIYNKRDSYMVIGGLIFYHILVACLCAFWIYKFLISSYDPGVFILLAMFVGGTVLCDVILHRTQAFSRFLLRFKTDSRGVHCFGLGWKKWSILWNDIHIFGVTGFSAPTGMGIIFLSTDPGEKFSREKCVAISRERIVFQADEKIWSKLSIYMPDKIKIKLRNSINEKRDCFYRC